jgi:FkbM family methyltransferase
LPVPQGEWQPQPTHKEFDLSVRAAAKQLSIAAGLYRPARWVFRRLRFAPLNPYPSAVQLYRSLLPQGALCFDVGANIGHKSEALLLAGCRVVAFEPNPMVIPELRARCGGNPDWTLVEAGLGSSAAVATLYACASSGQSSLLPDWGGQVIATSHVPIVTLDAAIRQFGIPYYCKIDVEGWELEVLRGLTQSIPVISFEFHVQDEDLLKVRACLNRLSELGATDANVTVEEACTLQFAEWMPFRQFHDWFPGNLSGYGDIFVRNRKVHLDGEATPHGMR